MHARNSSTVDRPVLDALVVADWTGCDMEAIVDILPSANTGLTE